MNEESVGSVTFVYDKMRTGDDDAATELWQRFASQLAARAQMRLRGRRSQSVVGPDDAVVDVLDTVFRRAREGTFPAIDSRRDLWKILVTITDRKCASMNRHFDTEKRGGKAHRVEPLPADQSGNIDPLNDAPDSTVNQPEVLATATETFDYLMKLLDEHDDKLRLSEIAELRMAGWSNVDIGKQIERSVKVVERRLKLIRELWREWDPRS